MQEYKLSKWPRPRHKLVPVFLPTLGVLCKGVSVHSA